MPGRFPLVALVIADGWGQAPRGPGNAVTLARTPVFDSLVAQYPHTLLEASGAAVGLPDGQMGNSEVGHLTIGAGRHLHQDLERVNKAIENGSLTHLPAIEAAFSRGRRLHLVGLVSRGGVHSHLDHLRALLDAAPADTWIHAFTDGRDVSPHAALGDLATLPQDRIATVAGRYWAMDRDNRVERTQKALDALMLGLGDHATNALDAVRASYDAGITDEFVEPTVIDGTPRIEPDDTVIFFNFRPDRARQLSRAFLEAGVDLTTMTRYGDDIDSHVVFGEQVVPHTLAEVLSGAGVRQLHVAESEKYAHVTYFFNGGREDEWAGETRILVPSRRDVPSYDLAPAMSADEVAERFCTEIGDGYGFGLVNFANPDMVGHTGVIPAVVAAVEETDRCVGRVVERVTSLGGVCLVTADHGNAEQLLEADGVSPHTAHTTNLVPFILTADAELRGGGELADLAPTVLSLLGVQESEQMSGKDLLKHSESSLRVESTGLH
ncbi:MAG TPA: 2,3-bisphosphoglycerate-independent phosphoglycerate mutase [Gaiellaceae bacterium]|nr:2,3-bisphosphoglycerate-independent phosphoglycerate mutase [Gaiellaceae bacterium]